MRHRVYGKHLGRDKNARTSLFKSLVGSLILHGEIVTTESKAKAIKGLIDKIITQAKGRESRRFVSEFLTNKNIQDKLFKETLPVLKERNSGYTSIIRLGRRAGDNAMTVRMSLLIEPKAKKEIATSSFGKLRTPRNDEKKIVKKSPRKVVKK